MHNMKIRKLAGVLAAAMALTALPISANAAEAGNKEVNLGGNKNGEATEDGAFTADDPAGRYGLSPANVSATGVALNVTGEAIDGGGINTDIAVWGYTEDGTVYSVDVEWGAMTFQYELSSWDPETHMAKPGGEWGVYDAANEKRLGDVQDAINRITVTNHSNAAVYAGLKYTAVTSAAVDGEDDNYKDISGEFAASEKADSEDFKATFDADTSYISLETADNATTDGKAGTPTVCNVYFKPVALSEAHKTAGITKWTKIGVITVSLQTEDPAATPSP